MVRREARMLRRTPTMRSKQASRKQKQNLKLKKKTRKVVEITVITLMKKHGLFKSIKF